MGISLSSIGQGLVDSMPDSPRHSTTLKLMTVGQNSPLNNWKFPQAGMEYIILLLTITLLMLLTHTGHHQGLLLIGDMEQNSGPVSGEDILASLWAQALDTTVRDTLGQYRKNMTTAQLTKAFKKSTKVPLWRPQTNYLNISGQSAHTKDAIVLNLICRIQNLLPDTCNICEDMNCTPINEIPLLKYSICGQGAHTPCILWFLYVNEDKRENCSQDDVEHMVNASEIPGIHYLCKVCEKKSYPHPTKASSGRNLFPMRNTLT